MAAPTIARLEERNYVGLCHLDVVEADQVQTVPDELDGNVATTVTLKGGASWSRIYLDDNGGLFAERWQLENGQQYSRATITGAVAKDRLALMPGLWKMKGKRYLVVFTTRNGDKLLMGRKETPAVALVTNRTSGDDPDSDRNQYEVVFELTRRLPVPFYQGTPPEPSVPGECPTLCTQIAGAEPDEYSDCIISSGHLEAMLPLLLPAVEPENMETWVLDQLSPEQLAAAEASICDVPGDGTVKTTDGVTTVLTVAPAGEENLPQSVIKYRNLSNALTETAPANTEFGSGVLKPATEVPRRALRNSAGTGFNFVHVGQLIADTVPTMPDVSIRDQDNNEIASAPAGTNYSVIVVSGIDGGESDTFYTNSIIQP